MTTVTFTGTSSSEPSGYLTRTFPVTSSPGFLSAGMVTVTFPLSSIVTTPGVLLVYVVPAGIVLPLASLTGISTDAPGLPLPSSYFGV